MNKWNQILSRNAWPGRWVARPISCLLVCGFLSFIFTWQLSPAKRQAERRPTQALMCAVPKTHGVLSPMHLYEWVVVAAPATSSVAR